MRRVSAAATHRATQAGEQALADLKAELHAKEVQLQRQSRAKHADDLAALQAKVAAADDVLRSAAAKACQ